MKLTEQSVTVRLPLPGPDGQSGGSGVSPAGVLCALLLALACSNATADEALDRQVDQAVHQYFTQQLADKAAEEGWQNPRFTQKVFALPDGAPTGPCEQPLQARGTEQHWSGYGRLRLTLACPAPAWSVDVTVQATVYIQAVMATRVIEREQLITSAMLGYQEVAVSRQSSGYFNRIDQVAGLSAKRRTRSQQVLSRDMLVEPWQVRRGERVTVVANHGDIHASTEGEALQDGHMGMLIRVRNTASGKVIEARVIGRARVTSTLERPGK